MTPSHWSKQSPFKLLIVLFILAIAAVPTIPNYFTGNWFWKNSTEIPTIQQLRSLQKDGLSLPGWQILNHEAVEIGGHKWLRQTMLPDAAGASTPQPITLLLKPQTWYRDQPQVEWMDINGAQQWTADRQSTLRFTVEIPSAISTSRLAKPLQIETRFLRGWNQQQTDAVLQWYAWSTGGNPAPNRWFWADQFSQLRDRRRMPWVAVSILIPIKPVGEIEAVRPLAKSLGQAVQSALITGALSSKS